MNDGTRSKDLSALKVSRLREMAREQGISGAGKMKKAELISALQAVESPVAEIPEREADQTEPTETPSTRSPWARGLGILMQLVGGAGFLGSLAAAVISIGLVVLGEPKLQSFLDDGEAQVRSAARSVRLAGTAMTGAADTLERTAVSLELVDATFDSAETILLGVGDLLGGEARDALIASQQSLVSAQSGAQAIEGMLRVLSSIPLLNVPYNPEQSLEESLGQTVEALEPLPETLEGMQGQLHQVQEDMQPLQRQIALLTRDLNAFSSTLDAFSRDMERQEDKLINLADWIENLAGWTGAWLGILLIPVEIAFLSTAMTHIVMVMVGSKLLRTGEWQL